MIKDFFVFMMRPGRDYLLPMLLASVSWGIFSFPEATSALQYDRSLLLPFFYRLVTGHFTHWTSTHMVVDTTVFCVMAVLCMLFDFQNKFSWQVCCGCIVFSAIVISAAVYFLQPAIKLYRGLSGIDWALYGVLMVQFFRSGKGVWRFAAWIMVFLFIFKMSLQLLVGHSMVVTYMGPGIVNMPLAHMAGFAAGTVYAMVLASYWNR